MRLSETGFLTEFSKGLQPSLGFKFLRDGAESVNTVAMSSFSQSNSWNFFEEPLRNRVDPMIPADANG